MADLYVTLIAVTPFVPFAHPDARSDAEVGDRPQGEDAHFTGEYGQLGKNKLRRTRKDPTVP